MTIRGTHEHSLIHKGLPSSKEEETENSYMASGIRLQAFSNGGLSFSRRGCEDEG